MDFDSKFTNQRDKKRENFKAFFTALLSNISVHHFDYDSGLLINVMTQIHQSQLAYNPKLTQPTALGYMSVTASGFGS